MNRENVRVLLVEDNPTDAMLVQRELEQMTDELFTVIHVEGLNEALARVVIDFFDVVLLDLSLPDSHGFETFVRLHAAAMELPIVVLSGRADGRLAFQALQAGAQDYLVKGRLGEDVLRRSIRYAIERQRSERSVAESEERFRLLIQQSPHGYLVHCGGEIVFANAAALKIFGAEKPGQLLGKPYLETVGAAFQEEVNRRNAHPESLADHSPQELLCVRLDGSTVPVEESSSAFVHLGRPAVQVVLQDITERKRAETAKREHAALLQAIFDHVPMVLCFIGEAGTIEWINREAERVFGRSLMEIQAELDITLWLFPDAEARKTVQAFIGEATGKFTEFETCSFQGTKIPMSWASVKLADGSIVGIGLDITERKRSEQRFRWLVDSNAQGVMFWNATGEVTGGNDAFLNMVGYTREEMEAGEINWILLTPMEYAQLDEKALETVIATGACAPYEKDFVRKDGSRVPIMIGAATFENNREEGVCFILDLTESKKIERNALRNQRMESIGTLAGGIAHDLNNTLTPIIMALELLKSQFKDRASQELLAVLNSSAQRGADMVRQVLSFARGVEGRRMEVQVKHLLREIEKIVNDTFLKNIELRTIFPAKLWTVIGDPTQLHQVLLNLCVNARDAMPKGGILMLSAENLTLDSHYAGLTLSGEAAAGPYVLIEVKDTGTGMPADVLEKIFDPFFTTKELGKGTGLGLSTSLAILKSHKAFLQVQSELGKGTTFSVYIPAEINSSLKVQELACEHPRGHGELILVVDDEPAVRQITQQTLELFGYRAILACDGVEAVGLYALHGAEIAVVLTDIMMPVMDGPTMIQVLLKMNPKLLIIGASGFASDRHAFASTSAGVKQFLAKPYTAETLLVALQQVLALPTVASES